MELPGLNKLLLPGPSVMAIDFGKVRVVPSPPDSCQLSLPLIGFRSVPNFSSQATLMDLSAELARAVLCPCFCLFQVVVGSKIASSLYCFRPYVFFFWKFWNTFPKALLRPKHRSVPALGQLDSDALLVVVPLPTLSLTLSRRPTGH